MKSYLVFMDIDGTLIDNHQNVLPKTKAVIETLQQRGVTFYIATGRMLLLARSIQRKINDQVKITASNGAVYQVDDEFEKTYLGRDAIKKAFDVAMELNLSCSFFTTDMTFFMNKEPWELDRMAQMRVMAEKDAERQMRSVHKVEELLEFEDQITNGIIIDASRSPRLNQARKALAESGLFSLSSSNADNIELIPKGITKASAIRSICEETNIPIEQTIAFGNDMNDLEMLQTAGIGVAMANSPASLQKAADRVTDSNLEDGIGNFLEKFFAI